METSVCGRGKQSEETSTFGYYITTPAIANRRPKFDDQGVKTFLGEPYPW